MNGLLHDIPDTWSAGLKGEESHIGAVFLYSGVPPPAGGLAPPVPDRPAMTMSPDLPPARTHTTTALLAALHDLSDQPAWREFEGRYAPIISGVARRMGLSESDSQDVMQETMLQFIRDYRAGKYDRTRGRLRSWIIGIARHRIADIRRRTAAGSIDHEAAVSQQIESAWSAELEAQLVRHALIELRDSTRTAETTIRAFELLVVQGLPAAQVAAALGITPHDACVAKGRVASRLRDIIRSLRPRFEEE